MLLIDNDQPQAGELHIVLKQGVGAHHQLCRTVGDIAQGLVSCLAFDFARQPAAANAQRFKPGREVIEVLFGQNFGGCHQRHLITRFQHITGSQCRHQSFAGTNIALHQPQHGIGLANILLNFFHHPLLGAGGCEWQLCQQLLLQLLAAADGGCLMGLYLSPNFMQRQLMGQQLFENQAFLRRVLAG